MSKTPRTDAFKYNAASQGDIDAGQTTVMVVPASIAEELETALIETKQELERYKSSYLELCRRCGILVRT